MLTVTLCILSHGRPREVATAMASARAAPIDERLLLDQATAPPLPVPQGVRGLRSERNLGIAGGRNALAAAATGDVLLFLDDDAVLLPGAVEAVRDALTADPGLAAVAMRIERPGGEMMRHEQPFPRWRTAPEHQVPCGYFIGAGFAIRRAAYEAIGGSDERLVYGADEIQLSLRIAAAGLRIAYVPAARIEHRPSTAARVTSAARAGMHLHNRLLMVRASLPRPLAAVHATVWSAITLREARAAHGVGEWWHWLGRGLRSPVSRRPMGWPQAWRLQRLGGRVLF